MLGVSEGRKLGVGGCCNGRRRR